MPQNSYIFPTSGLGFARDACLTVFGSTVPAVSGVGYLATGTYEAGDIYTATLDAITPTPNNLNPFNPSTPSPIIFGDWVYALLGGGLPTTQLTGGLAFLGGATGSASWSSLAFTGTEALQISTNFGGVLGFDSALPSLGYPIIGTEVFSVQYQAIDNLPGQIEIQFYESTMAQWHSVYVGTDDIGLGGFNLGPVPAVLNSWVQLTFTPSDLGLSPGDVITGMAWGVWNSAGTSTVVFSDTGNLNAAPVPLEGFIDCVQDNNFGFFILSHFGPLFHIPALGAPVTTIPLATTPSFAYTGMTYNPSNGQPYFVGYDGTIYEYNGSTVSTIAGIPAGTLVPAKQLFCDNSNNLYTLFANSNDVGIYSIGGSSWSKVASPFDASLDTLYYSLVNDTYYVGGSIYQNTAESATIIAIAYANNPNQLLEANNTPQIKVYDFSNGNWAFDQIVGGYTGIPTQIATEPDGMQALVTDSTNNLIEVLTYVGGVWNQTSTVSIIDPTAIVTYTSGITQAAVCQPSQNRISFLNKSVLAWNIAQTITVSGPTDIAIQQNTNTNAIVSTSTGVSFLEFNGAVWINKGDLALSPVPTQVAADAVAAGNTLFYAAAQSGSTTTVYIFQNQALVGQYTISGSTLTQLEVVDYEILVGSTSGDLYTGYYIGGVTNNVLTNTTIPANSVAMQWIATVTDFVPFLLVAGPNNLWSFYNDSPQSYTRIADAQVAIWSGGWQIVDMANRNLVASITTDVSGNIFAVTTDNAIYQYSSVGVLASGYPYVLLPPPNQEENIPLGLSKLQWYNNKLVAASSLMGGLTIITP